jgi:hypothetical protein
MLDHNDRPEPIIKTDFIEVSHCIKVSVLWFGFERSKVTELKHLKPEP